MMTQGKYAARVREGRPWYEFDWIPQKRDKLSNKLRKIERDLQDDAEAKIRARAAQYRQDVLKTLAEVESVHKQSKILSSKLDIEDAKLIRDLARTNDKSMTEFQQLIELGRETELRQHMLENEKWFSRLVVASMGSLIGYWVAPDDIRAPVTGAAVFGYLTTRDDVLGSATRIVGSAGVQILRKLTDKEKKYEVVGRAWNFFLETIEAVLPFDLPGRAPHWRNAYGGEGFLHPDVKPPPRRVRGAEYIEYLDEVERWVRAEKEAVVEKLKQEEDERAEKYMKDKERMEKVTLALNTAITKIGNLTSATLEKISQEDFAAMLKGESSGLAELKRKYWDLAKTYHPDTNFGEDKDYLNEVMMNLSVAYQSARQNLLEAERTPQKLDNTNPQANLSFNASGQFFNRFQQGWRPTATSAPRKGNGILETTATATSTAARTNPATVQSNSKTQVTGSSQMPQGSTASSDGSVLTKAQIDTQTILGETSTALQDVQGNTGSTGTHSGATPTSAQSNRQMVGSRATSQTVQQFGRTRPQPGETLSWNSMKKTGNLYEQLQRNQVGQTKSSTKPKPATSGSVMTAKRSWQQKTSDIVSRARESDRNSPSSLF